MCSQRLADRIATLRGKRKLPGDEGDAPVAKRAKKDVKKKGITAPAPKQDRYVPATGRRTGLDGFKVVGVSGSLDGTSLRRMTATLIARRLCGRVHIKAQGASGQAVNAGDGEVVYSKFDFSAIEKKKKKQSKDYKALLAKVCMTESTSRAHCRITLLHGIPCYQAETNKAKLAELKASDPEKAKEVIVKQKQRKAMEMAMGIKQLDDPTLLKKSIKAKEKQKKKSKQAWCVLYSSPLVLTYYVRSYANLFRCIAQPLYLLM